MAAVEPEEEANKERHCDSLIMCIVTTLNEGLRNGGGIGDVLRKPSSTVRITMGCVKLTDASVLSYSVNCVKFKSVSYSRFVSVFVWIHTSVVHHYI